MRATIRRFHSPDGDLDSFAPSNAEDVGVLVQMMVGPSEGTGEESFDVVVCTPRWLEGWVATHGTTPGRHHLIVERWDWPTTMEYLRQTVEREEEDSWPRLAARLSRIGKWEFEDYDEP